MCVAIHPILSSNKKLLESVAERDTARLKATLNLMKMCGFDENKIETTFQDFEHITSILKTKKGIEVCIHIIDYDNNKQKFSTSNKNTVPNEDNHHIYIFKMNNHYDLIRFPKVFLGFDKICHQCEKGFWKSHICNKNIPKKQNPNYTPKAKAKKCSYCKMVNPPLNHFHCRNCLEDTTGKYNEDKCYMTNLDIEKLDKQRPVELIFFDFETYTDEFGFHYVDYAVAQYSNGDTFLFFDSKGLYGLVIPKRP